MYFRAADIRELDEAHLREFLGRGIPEGTHLDYKRALTSGSKEKAYREFLKDVTAFANAQGGNLLLGVIQPKDGQTVDEQLVGMESGDELAASLEDVASAGVDPRIPGLQIHPVKLASGKWVLIAHVPPSPSRPHMVSHSGEFTFYIRHREQIKPMTTHEVRETVVSALSAEARVRAVFKEREEQLFPRPLLDKPAFLLQAAPMVALEAKWDVYSDEVARVLWGHSRMNSARFTNLSTNDPPRPNIDGVYGVYNADDPKYVVEVHRNGYVSVIFRDFDTVDDGGTARYVLHQGYCEMFLAFASILKEVWETTKTDLPYAVSCVLLGAAGSRFLRNGRYREASRTYTQYEMRWPAIFRQVGQNPTEIATELCEVLFHAYGFHPPRKP